MENRKILTLNEILSLDRRPTLQEMVDLSIEDYTKYLYHKGIIKYIPESGSVVNYEPIRDIDGYCDYVSGRDLILDIKKGFKTKKLIEGEEYELLEFEEDEILNEDENGFIGELGTVIINEKEYNYVIDDFDVTFYEIDDDGDKFTLKGGFLGYLGQTG